MNLRKFLSAGLVSLSVVGGVAAPGCSTSAAAEVPPVEMNPPGAGHVGAHGARGTARGYSNNGKGYAGHGRGPMWGISQSYGYKAGLGHGADYHAPLLYFVIPDGYDWTVRGQVIVHRGTRYVTVGDGVMTLLVD